MIDYDWLKSSKYIRFNKVVLVISSTSTVVAATTTQHGGQQQPPLRLPNLQHLQFMQNYGEGKSFGPAQQATPSYDRSVSSSGVATSSLASCSPEYLQRIAGARELSFQQVETNPVQLLDCSTSEKNGTTNSSSTTTNNATSCSRPLLYYKNRNNSTTSPPGVGHQHDAGFPEASALPGFGTSSSAPPLVDHATSIGASSNHFYNNNRTSSTNFCTEGDLVPSGMHSNQQYRQPSAFGAIGSGCPSAQHEYGWSIDHA